MENPQTLKIRFLGTGTSTGVPQIGCECEVCKSTNPKDKRLRCSVLISDDTQQVLIDCGPDFRQQAIDAEIKHLNGILISHEHYDHVGGLDDIRPLGDTHIYAEKRVLAAIRRNMPYCFTENRYPGAPMVDLHEIVESENFKVGSWKIIPLRIMHGNLPILGYRIGKLAYLTDVKEISEEVISQLFGLDVLVLNALRKEPHPSHISVSEAVALGKRLKAKQVYFTHFSHQIGLHELTERTLPENFHLAYDQLVVNLGQ